MVMEEETSLFDRGQWKRFYTAATKPVPAPSPAFAPQNVHMLRLSPVFADIEL